MACVPCRTGHAEQIHVCAAARNLQFAIMALSPTLLRACEMMTCPVLHMGVHSP